MADTQNRLQRRIDQLRENIVAQAQQHEAEGKDLDAECAELKTLTSSLELPRYGDEGGGVGKAATYFDRRVEWTITDYAKQVKQLERGKSIFSPKFKAAGLEGIQLEFFPKGREKTTHKGFCSLFLWCSSAANGTKMKYQLWVGSFLRTPDEETFRGRIGHGHSNFCPVEPEVDKQKDAVTVGVDFLEVLSDMEVEEQSLKLISPSLASTINREVQIIRNRNVENVTWRIPKANEVLSVYHKGTSMISPCFTAAGIRELLLEFYPNGSPNTSKEGFCAFYIRCPERASVIVTLFVGNTKKGPIKTTFDSQTGKGLPDFCRVQDQINSDGSIEVGILVENQPNPTLTMVRD